MEMALQFNELTADELYSLDGGMDAYEVGYAVGKYLGIGLTVVWVYLTIV